MSIVLIKEFSRRKNEFSTFPKASMALFWRKMVIEA
jgi:hypothetical protein